MEKVYQLESGVGYKKVIDHHPEMKFITEYGMIKIDAADKVTLPAAGAETGLLILGGRAGRPNTIGELSLSAAQTGYHYFWTHGGPEVDLLIPTYPLILTGRRW